MAVTIIGATPIFGNTFKNTWSVSDLDITFLTANRDVVAIPTDYAGANPVFTEANAIFRVEKRGDDVTSEWAISKYATDSVTISINDITKTVSVTAISADTGSFVIKAYKVGENPIYRKISVFKVNDGAGWTGGSYNSANGITTFTSDDGLGFSTTDLRGADGLGWTGASYNSSTGVTTFTSDDGLGFVTGDLRGSSGGGTVQEINRSIHPVTVIGSGVGTLGDDAIDLQTYTSGSGSAAADYSLIIGGRWHSIDSDASTSSIVGGQYNRIIGSTTTSMICGGSGNVITTTDLTTYGGSFIGGGVNNTISNATVSNIIGSENTITSAHLSSVIGYHGDATTPGEVVFSNTSSAVQKSIFILEGESVASETVTLQTLGRTSGTAPGLVPSNIIIGNNTAFSGSIILTGTRTGPEFSNKKLSLGWVCDGSGNVTTKLGTEDTNYQDNSQFDAALSFVTTTANQLIITIVSTATDCLWTAIVEGIKMDI